MQCPHCGSEWVVRGDIAGQVTRCPFCQNSLQSRTSARMETLEDCLRSIYQQFGMVPFQKGKPLLGLHSDLMPQREKDRRLLNLFLMCDGHTVLLDTLKKPKNQHSVEIARLSRRMQEDWMLRSGPVREICSAFWLAIGGDREALKGIEEQSAPAPVLPSQPAAPAPKKASTPTVPARPAKTSPAQTSSKPRVRRHLGAVCNPSDYSISGDLLKIYYGRDHNIGIPDGVKRIDDAAFMDCTDIGQVYLPDSVHTIGDSAFLDCSSLKLISMPDDLKTIGPFAFSRCSVLEPVLLPANLQTLGRYAFADCRSIKRISLPDSLQTIEEFTFSDCISLQSVTFPRSLHSVGESAFMDCSALQNLMFPKGLQEIREFAFSGCRSLKTIAIPDSVTFIDDTAFADCGKITVMASPAWRRAHQDLVDRIENPLWV